ncbi:vitamin K epoxide reductase family protein [Gordonia hydrophobica]|uniref:Vitamin K epoxide reductase family protein n=1 Tax=Gordonia hydrophobica TaxID=40516 RepID=A0ABZ2TYT9_9ACTN|nr:vitamin K epoxide reductase family protein [Gordonia hydrophobica]MBM7365755.1 putative membrane protein [Gordonia hydrophobica]
MSDAAETASVTPAADEPESPAASTGSFWSQPRSAPIATGWVLLVTGALGMAAAIALLLDRIQLLIDPSFVPACSINPIISCGSVMVTEQGKFFGFPNPMLGLPAFAVILVTAVLTLGRVRLPRWYWLGQAIVTFLGQIFVGYLIFQSLYRIHALCPYCMVVWTIVPIIFLLSMSRVLPDGHRGRSMREWLWMLLPLYYVVVISMITVEFWDYWKTLI